MENENGVTTEEMETTEEVQEVEETEAVELPDWMQDEEPDSSDSTMPVAAHVKAKHKFKESIREKEDALKEKDSRIDELEKKIALIEQGKQAPAVNLSDLKVPHPDDYDTDAEYRTAMSDYTVKVVQASTSASLQGERSQEQQKQFQAEVEEKVNNHYARAEDFVKKYAIDPKVYTEAEKNIRNTFKSVFREQGDVYTDRFIADIGDGSEKVMLNIGRSPAKVAQLSALLKSDPSGLQAAIYLGEVKGQISNSQNKQSQARKPVPNANGDISNNMNASKMKKAYDDAHKKGDMQKVMSMKRQAKKAGVDVSGW